MSISVLLVDDEELERVLIRHGFSWAAYDFEIIGEAGTAREAIDFVEENKPDVVVTDISMPCMDGLDMTRLIKEIHPDCMIVVVTGYRDFEYAKRAVSLNVEDFLLKPVSVEEIEKVMLKIKAKHEEMKTQVKHIEMLEKEYYAAENIVMESFFIRLVEGKVKESEALQKLDKYNKKELLRQCTCISIRVEEGSKEKGQKEIINYMVRNISSNSLCFVHYLNDIIVVSADRDCSGIIELCRKLISKLSLVNIKIKIGIGEQGHGLAGIAETFRKSLTACEASMVMGYESIYTYREYEQVLAKETLDSSFDWEGYEAAVNQCMEKEVDFYIEEYVELLKKKGRADKDYLKVMMINILFRGSTALKRYGVNLPGIVGETKFYEEINQVNTMDEIQMCLKQNLSSVMSYLKNRKYKPQNKTIQEAETYIRNHLFDNNLALRTIAAEIFANESYLSRIFKKEIGITLTEYITKERIEASKSMMVNPEIRISEIAEKVGFKDAHYFGICFKRIVGKTVSEYRKKADI